jgi:signal transduction histidine kinase
VRFKDKLSLFVLPLVLIPSLAAGIIIYSTTRGSLIDLYFSVLELEMRAFMRQAEAENAVLERLRLVSSPFYAGKARDKVAEYAASRSGAPGTFLILDGMDHAVLSPVGARGEFVVVRVEPISWGKGLKRVTFIRSPQGYVGIENFFEPWGWRIYALLPFEEPSRSAAAALAPGIAFLAFAAAAAAWGSRAIAKSVSRPVELLAEATKRMGEGDLKTRAQPLGDEELKILATSFNEMAARIAQLAGGLEATVAQRTSELDEANVGLRAANAELRKTLEELGEAQDRLVSSERLAALGQLSAGIAHELNTPLGAIISSNASLADVMDTRLPEAPAYFASLDGPRRAWFARALELSLRPSAGEREKAAGDRARAREERKALEAELAAEGIPWAEEAAALLNDLDLRSSADELRELLRDPCCCDLLEHVSDLVSARSLVRVIETASQKAAHVVGALRGYLQYDEKDDAAVVDVAEGVETVLTLVRSKSLQGVRIELRLRPGLTVVGNPHKLGQVWMNIVDNAMQAMEYSGDLLIESSISGDRILVSFTDSGPGIPESVRERLFQPFFTTKRKGEGIGLGLHICRKIVEGFGGRIELESRPGRTTFLVYLPAAPASPS